MSDPLLGPYDNEGVNQYVSDYSGVRTDERNGSIN
jgi:hypothetical protein